MTDDLEKEHKEPESPHSEHGKAIFEWNVPEYARHNRSRLWYIVAAIVTALLLLTALRSGNFLFAIIVIMFAVIMVLNSLQEPEEMRVAITERGLVWGEHYHSYIDVSTFWIVYQPPEVKNLYVEFKSALKPRLNIPLGEESPVAIREFLKKVAKEDTTRDDEPLSDFLGRVLKI